MTMTMFLHRVEHRIANTILNKEKVENENLDFLKNIFSSNE